MVLQFRQRSGAALGRYGDAAVLYRNFEDAAAFSADDHRVSGRLVRNRGRYLCEDRRSDQYLALITVDAWAWIAGAQLLSGAGHALSGRLRSSVGESLLHLGVGVESES